MPTLQTLRDALLGRDETREYGYECTVCAATFTATEPTVQTVACPQCGANSVRERLTTGDQPP